FDLRLADILARQKHVLVERHRLAFPSVAVRSGAKPLLGPRQLSARKGPKDPKERRHWEPGIALPSRLWCEPASRSASNRSGWWRLLYAIASSGQAQRQRPEGAADVATRSPARARWGCVARCVPRCVPCRQFPLELPVRSEGYNGSLRGRLGIGVLLDSQAGARV